MIYEDIFILLIKIKHGIVHIPLVQLTVIENSISGELKWNIKFCQVPTIIC